MKKLAVIIALLAVIAACTKPGIEENYDTEIQLIDKEKVENPRDRKEDN